MEISSSQFTLEEALEAIGFGKFQIKLLFLCGAGYAAGTIELILVALLLPEISDEFDLEPLQASIFSSVTFLGELVGGILWGWISDKFGRRISFTGTVILSTFFGLISAAAPNYFWLCFFRFFLGVALGGNLSVDFVLFLEFVGSKTRGFYATFIILFGITGVLATAGIGWAVIEPLGWRWYLVICTSPFILVLFARLLWKYESPRYLLVSGKTEEALAVLREVARQNGTKMPEGTLIPLPEDETKTKARIQDLLSPNLRKTTLTLCLVWFSITYGYYGITIWLPNYLGSLEIPSTEAAKSLLWMGLAELPGLAVSNILIDRIGRKYSLGIAMIGCTISSMCFGFANTYASITGLSMAIYFFIVQAWSIVYIYTPELFPTTHRSTAYGVTGLFATLAGILSGPLGGLMLDSNLETWSVLLVYSILFLLGGLAALFLKETSKTILEDTIHQVAQSTPRKGGYGIVNNDSIDE